jgi:hypothetical protein
MIRRHLVALLFLGVLGVSATAQQMPDFAQMAGRPLPAPELETGMVSVRVVRERMGNNVTNHPVTLTAAERTLNATTDAQGRATFGSIPVGTRITVSTVVDGETLRSQEFEVPSAGGVRVALIAGLEAAAARERAEREAAAKEPPTRGVVVFGGESRVIMEFQDDNLQVFYLLDIVNNARTPVDTGEPLVLVLPEGAVGAGTLQGSSPVAVVQNDRLRITGPFAPGTTSVQIGFRYPYRGDTATITQQWPAAFEQLFFAIEKIGNVQVSSPQFEQQRDANAGGSPFIMATGGRLNAGESLTITLSGLPHRPNTLRNVGVGIGLFILIAGLWAGITGGRRVQHQTAELAKRKEKLLADLVQLEAQHREGRVDARRYASRRQTLLTQLEAVMAEIDGSAAAGSPPRRGPGDGQGLAA